MNKLRIPGSFRVGEPIGTTYPIDDHGTGFNNLDYNGYGSVQDRISVVPHPYDKNRAPGFLFKVNKGDKQPHYGASGQRAELWPEPHQIVNGTYATFAMSFVLQSGKFKSPAGWGFIFQTHTGEGDTDISQGGAVQGITINDGKLGIHERYMERKFLPMTLDVEHYFQLELKVSTGNDGFAIWHYNAGLPPDAAGTPIFAFHGRTMYGTPMYPKFGAYVPAGAESTEVLWTTFSGQYDSVANARAAAGWGGVVAQPPVPPKRVTVAQTINDGATVQDTITWVATTSDDAQVANVEFLIDGVVDHKENSAPYGNGDMPDSDNGQFNTKKRLADGKHTLGVIANLNDGTHVQASAVVTVKNVVTPPPPVVDVAKAKAAVIEGLAQFRATDGYIYTKKTHPKDFATTHSGKSEAAQELAIHFLGG